MDEVLSQAAQDRRQMVSNLAFIQDALRSYEDRPFVVGIDASLTDTAITAIGPGTEHGRWMVRMYDAPAATKNAAISQTCRMSIIRRYAIKAFQRHPAKLVTIEDYAYNQPQGATLLGEVGGVLRLCVFHDHPELVGLVVLVSPTQLKKYIVGRASKGQKSVKKEKVLQRLVMEYRLEADNNNQGDATVLAIIARDLVRVVSEIQVEQFYDEGGAYDDQRTMEFIKHGGKDWKLEQYKWEVLISLIKNRCGESIYDYRPLERAVADSNSTAAAG